ncbi:MAG: ketopantoate reductase C-terminal domain-containing protein, partial [SAR202 cluster bacterium]|nr:ketopantoate reductase C-terminal domain-containing protein [SAR202 cluster bacterium]
HGGGCSITFGKQSDIQEGRVRELANIFESSNVDFTVSENIHDSLWQKLVFISALSGMTCITKSTFKEVMNHPETRNITINLVRETASVASKIVPNFSKDTVQNTIDHLETHKNDLVSSMHQDLLAGKPMEINAINGAVSRKGKTLGIATPINDMIVSCLSLQDTRARK